MDHSSLEDPNEEISQLPEGYTVEGNTLKTPLGEYFFSHLNSEDIKYITLLSINEDKSLKCWVQRVTPGRNSSLAREVYDDINQDLSQLNLQITEIVEENSISMEGLPYTLHKIWIGNKNDIDKAIEKRTGLPEGYYLEGQKLITPSGTLCFKLIASETLQHLVLFAFDTENPETEISGTQQDVPPVVDVKLIYNLQKELEQLNLAISNVSVHIPEFSFTYDIIDYTCTIKHIIQESPESTPPNINDQILSDPDWSILFFKHFPSDNYRASILSLTSQAEWSRVRIQNITGYTPDDLQEIRKILKPLNLEILEKGRDQKLGFHGDGMAFRKYFIVIGKLPPINLKSK